VKKYFPFDPDEGAFCLLFKDGFKFPPNKVAIILMSIFDIVISKIFNGISIFLLIDFDMNQGKLPRNFERNFQADSLAFIPCTLLGCPEPTSYIKSFVGISIGARTGLASLVTALIFLLCIFILPVFAFFPSAVIGAVFIYNGISMLKMLKKIDFSQLRYSLPSFLTIVGIGFFFSITKGLGFGILSFFIINLLSYVFDFVCYFTNKRSFPPEWSIKPFNMILSVVFIIDFFFLK
jgi:xanthine/uracil/vitamin C permease (AzgA family)